MSTFLALCQKVSSLAGISGTGPAAVTSQTGVNAKLVSFTKDGWLRVQGESEHWNFMRKEGTLNTVAATQSYSAATILAVPNANYGTIIEKTLKFADRSGRLTYIPYAEWEAKDYDLLTGTGRPQVYTIKPDGALLLYPIPTAIHALKFHYRRAPQELAANADVPDLPDQYHDIITYRALMLYFEHDQAGPEWKSASANYDEWFARVAQTQLPRITIP